MRGYLWQSLAAEVQAEFDSLTPSGSSDALLATPRVTGPLWSGALFWGKLEWKELRAIPIEWRLRLLPKVEHAPPLTGKQRMAAVYARRRAEGRCLDCEEPRLPTHATCRVHFERRRAAYARHQRKAAAR